MATGFSVHVTFDVTGVEEREEATQRVLALVPELPEGVKVTHIHVGKYEITSLADKYKDLL